MTGLLISSLVPAESGLKTASSEEVISANNQFGCELYSRYVWDEDNLLFSPHSIFSIMAMVYEGARGRTKEEMQNVFHFSDDDLARRIFFREVYERIRNKNKPYQLNSANALWAQKDHLFLKSYSCIAEKYYGAKLTNLDFSGMTGARDLSISAVLHKAFIEVNEEGTEAAAATAAAMKYLTAIQIPEEIKVFNADRPFIFIIQEKENGNILFFRQGQ